MEYLIWIVVLAIIMATTGMLLGKIDRLFNVSDKGQSSVSDQEKGSGIDESSGRVEAVKQQIQRDVLPSIGNQPSVPTSNLENSVDKSDIPVVQKTAQTQEQQIININIEPDEIKSQAASEFIDVPKGVTIKVKRIRTVVHSINIEWAATITGKGEIGIKQLLSASIQGEIQRVKGYVSQQSESMEYEITLDGERYTQYKLIWLDVWLQGLAEIQNTEGTFQQPFQFRDRAELKVVPTSA